MPVTCELQANNPKPNLPVHTRVWYLFKTKTFNQAPEKRHPVPCLSEAEDDYRDSCVGSGEYADRA